MKLDEFTDEEWAEYSREKRETRVEEIKFLLGLGLILIAVAIFLVPKIKSIILNLKSKDSIERLQDYQRRDAIQMRDDVDRSELDMLLLESIAYNERIFSEKQKDLADVENFEQVPIELRHLEDDKAYAYIRIDRINQFLPIYIGASDDNLKKGLAVMGQTSLPIGMTNSNCVIAGHRGYHNIPLLRHIDQIEEGDIIEITNNWNTLLYEVTQIWIIDPDDLSPIYITAGKDMVTLMTCHPVHSGGKQRYLVVCERNPNLEIQQKSKKEEEQK